MSAVLRQPRLALPAAALGLLLTGCGAPAPEDGNRTRLRLQTDWYAQPEHGGHYQAMAAGLYADRGLDVEIAPGGPNALPLQRVARGEAHFGFSRSDDVIAAIDRGLPLVMVAAYLQKDPQALMLHAGDPAESWEDLDGRRIMAMPGSVWIDYLESQYDIDLDIVSLDYGLGRFLADDEIIQQCFISNQPFYARREGADVDTWLIAESGYNAPHVVFAHREFVERNRPTVEAFVRASAEGWRAYLHGDPSPANSIILRQNAEMSPEFIDYARTTLRELNLVTGDRERGREIGRLDRQRVENLLGDLREIEVIGAELTVDDVLVDVFTDGE